MKKKLFGFVLAAVLLLAASAAVLTGCTEEKATYKVTVLSFDGETPAESVRVAWQQSGKNKGIATTNADGVATAELPAGTYQVALLDLDDGVVYTSVSVNASQPNVILTLDHSKIRYSATVIDKNGVPAANAIVTWANAKGVAGSAVTGKDGVATAELNQSEYSVNVANLPSENVTSGMLTATVDSPDVRFQLVHGQNASYSVTVKSEGGLKFKNVEVVVSVGEIPVTMGKTNDNGVFTFALSDGTYNAFLNDLPDGYTGQPATLSATARETEITLYSSVITTPPADNKRYVLGDVIHNYSFTTPYNVNGKPATYTIEELLKTKKAIILNNWGVNCTWCVKEMPAMETAYQKYKDDIEMIAVSNYSGGDSDSTIVAFRNEKKLSFPMMRDTNEFTKRFGLTNWPTTVIIDRYGAVARIEVGAVVADSAWDKLINMYIADDYKQTFTPGDDSSGSINNELQKPDVILPDDHYDVLNDTFNTNFATDATVSVEWYPETEYEYAWPYLYATAGDLGLNDQNVPADSPVLYSSNAGKHSTMSILYGTLKTPAGKVFTFDYYADTEDGEDILSIVWDGKVIQEITGNSNGWQTCYLYTDLTDDTHTMAFAFTKDSEDSNSFVGKDNVYIRNMRFVSFADYTASIGQGESAYMWRSAAYGTPQTGDKTYPHYAKVEMGSDGYYHVVRNDLLGKEYAGVDESPLLLLNTLGATNWSGTPINSMVVGKDDETGEFLVDCNFTVNKFTKDYRADLAKYMQVSSASDIKNCVPVDQELRDLITEFMKRISGKNTHANEWLEACYYYSCYGTLKTIENPIMGLTEKTAYEITQDDVGQTLTADLTRNMNPFPINIYTFTPTQSGVYKFESLLTKEQGEKDSTQIWLYDDNTKEDSLAYCGEDYLTRDGVNEYNFLIHRYLEAGHKYYYSLAYQMMGSGTFEYKITLEGDKKTVLLPASGNYYYQVLDDLGNATMEVTLANAIDYTLHTDGYYHAVNADGSLGNFIYLDVEYPQIFGGMLSVKAAVNFWVKDPLDKSKELFKMYDFSKRIGYTVEHISETESQFGYFVADITSWGTDDLWGLEYKDYTDIMKGYIQKADKDGFVKVDEQLMKILQLFIESRNTMTIFDEDTNTVDYDRALENEWLRFCWYYKEFSATNP